MVVDQAPPQSSARDPSVDRVFERVNVGEGHVNVVLKKDRKLKSYRVRAQPSAELWRAGRHARKLPEQQGGGPEADARDVMLYPWRRGPGRADRVANKIAKEMETIPGLGRRASEATWPSRK